MKIKTTKKSLQEAINILIKEQFENKALKNSYDIGRLFDEVIKSIHNVEDALANSPSGEVEESLTHKAIEDLRNLISKIMWLDTKRG